MSQLQVIPVDRLSGAAAEAMKKMPPHKSSVREVYGEHDWGTTVDGRILPRHPFDLQELQKYLRTFHCSLARIFTSLWMR